MEPAERIDHELAAAAHAARIGLCARRIKIRAFANGDGDDLPALAARRIKSMVVS
jgi:hypothetical protein